MARNCSDSALMPVNLASFSLVSSVALNHLMNENNIDLVIVAEHHGSAFALEHFDVCRSKARKRGIALIVGDRLKLYALEDFSLQKVGFKFIQILVKFQ